MKSASSPKKWARTSRKWPRASDSTPASARGFCRPASAGAARASARTPPRWSPPPANMDWTSQIVKAARDVNRRQRERVVEKLLGELKILKGRTIGLLGLAFKPDTDDLREAPALDIARKLIERGARVKAHDPVAMEPFSAGVSGSRRHPAAPPPKKSCRIATPRSWSPSGRSIANSTGNRLRTTCAAKCCSTAAIFSTAPDCRRPDSVT